MQYYSNELFDLYKKDAFKLEIWKDGYPFSAEGIRQAHEDLGEHLSLTWRKADRKLCLLQLVGGPLGSSS